MSKSDKREFAESDGYCMKAIEEYLITDVAGEFDVIVVGGGPAGTGAAVAAARQGSKVLLIERMNALGGMWTSGFVNPLFDFENKAGILGEIIGLLKEKGQWGGFWNMSFNYEYMKHILEHLCLNAGVTLLYNTVFSKTLNDRNKVTGIVTQSIDGRKAYTCKILVDCSGDAVVAADAGAAIRIGDDEQKCQAMTLMFLIGNLNEKYTDGLMCYELLKNAFIKEGSTSPVPFEMPYIIPIPNTRFAAVQLTHMWGYDALSAREVTLATIEGRNQVIGVIEALRNNDADFADLELIQTAPLLGVRESRRIVGEYTITEDDLINGNCFEDGIVTATFNVDIHAPSSSKQVCWQVKPYQIPYRSLIPKGLEGILVAGRCISGTNIAMASYRVTGNCNAMGEMAGLAAHKAAKYDVSVRDVNLEDVMGSRSSH